MCSRFGVIQCAPRGGLLLYTPYPPPHPEKKIYIHMKYSYIQNYLQIFTKTYFLLSWYFWKQVTPFLKKHKPTLQDLHAKLVLWGFYLVLQYEHLLLVLFIGICSTLLKRLSSETFTLKGGASSGFEGSRLFKVDFSDSFMAQRE